MKLRRIISGGQTGADQGGWVAAKRLGLETGGEMPKGFLTEAGPRPEFEAMYGATESRSAKYPPRTAKNVHDADGTLILGLRSSRGSLLTAQLCESMAKPVYFVPYRSLPWKQFNSHVIDWLIQEGIETLNVAGNRESRAPGIRVWTAGFLERLLKGKLK